MIFTPRPYQPIMVEHILKHDRCALWIPMGMGKSSATLMALDILQLTEDNKTLVVAPLRVARSVWPEEAKKWDNFNHFKVVPILGDAKERLEALREPADIHTINYENLLWLALQVKDNWKWETVISDEATRLKSFRLKGRQTNSTKIAKKSRPSRARSLGKYAFTKIRRFVELTGTPSPNGLIDLWGQLWFLDKGQRLGRTLTDFKTRWFRFPHPNAYEMEPMPHAQAEIQEAVKDICLALKVEDWFDLQEPIASTLTVDLPPKARELYKKMEKEMFFKIQEKEVEALNAASKTIKCLQLASGAVYTDDLGNWEEAHDAKLEALESVVEEANGAPILLAYHFKSDLFRLKKRFPQGHELDQNESTIKKWNRGKIPILFSHPASAGHGLNLADGGNIIVFFSHWWDLEQRQQILERIGPVRQMQAGHIRPVYIYNIIARDTIDSTVLERHVSKRRVQDLLLEAAKR